MRYAEAVHWLYSRLPVFQRDGSQAYKPGLQRIRKLLDAIGNPHLTIPVVHVAGTNGKGSVAHMTASLLRKHGLNVGLYTSPHLVDLRERFRINGIPVPEDFITEFVERYMTHIEQIGASFFEVCVAMAFHFFKTLDVAVIEVGMGGRLDATNIVSKPLVSVITSIGFDHERFLGRTLSAIAREKAGIIKYGVPVVVGQNIPEEAFEEIKRIAEANNSELHVAKYDLGKVKYSLSNTALSLHFMEDILNLWLPMGGKQYTDNLQIVLKISEVLSQQGFIKLDRKRLYEAFAMFKDTTGWAGRWDVWSLNPLIIADIAHNQQSVNVLIENLKSFVPDKRIIAVFGISNDKNILHFKPFLERTDFVYVVEAPVQRSMPASQLAHTISEILPSKKMEVIGDVGKGIKTAMANSEKDSCIVITGSMFVVGEAYKWFMLSNSKRD
ncbi:MAG: bifunctional folylpolyglutamate synthase/dihydrofolate synthase [Chlorobi bacterium]|nr:bifunctional folylpolyglutamate synthase/dihydrofolate synthase [Chlorobiota bacterium]